MRFLGFVLLLRISTNMDCCIRVNDDVGLCRVQRKQCLKHLGKKSKSHG